MFKKFFVGLLIAMVGVCFGAEFVASEASKLLGAKDYVKLQQYLQTNNECKNDISKLQYNYYLFFARMTVKKDVNKSNIMTLVKQEFKEGKINFNLSLQLLFLSRIYIPELKQNLEFMKLTKQFYEENKTQKLNYCTHVFLSYMGLKEFDNLLNLLNISEEKQIQKFVCGQINGSYLKSFTTEQKITYFRMVSNNPSKFIRNANDLTFIVKQASKIIDTKYDSTMKELYTKLNRTFYSKITESEEWKQALVLVNLQIKAYGIQ